MKGRIVVVLGLVIAAVSATTASAVELVAWDSFSDGEAAISDSGGVWTQVNHSWSVQDGQARGHGRPNAHRIRRSRRSSVGRLDGEDDITLSPTDLCGPCVVHELSRRQERHGGEARSHPRSPRRHARRRRRINGQIHSTLCKVERLGLVNGVTYRSSVARTGDIMYRLVTSLATAR